MKNTQIRKVIARLKKDLNKIDKSKRDVIISKICYLKNEMADPNFSPPTLGRLRGIIEKDIEQEKLGAHSETDLKRLALKEAILQYYNDLDCDPETIVVEHLGDETLRRDNKKIDKTDLDFAPNKNKIYQIWMDKLRTLVRHSKLNKCELDEATDKGIPQGGAFEKQLGRISKLYTKTLWSKK